MSAKRVLLVVAALAFALAGTALAQANGRIEGRLEREDGAGVGGVAVVVNEAGLVGSTNADGSFRFAAVPAGTYSLSFTIGDHTDSATGVEVAAGQTARVDRIVDWDLSFADTITVVSASRRIERIVDAPAAVTVVTEQEIEREAAHGQLPKLLEFTPGAEVTQSGVYDYNFNTRGFNSSLNRRVATLIDGRNLSVPFLGAQEWAAVSFPLDDLANAELVRGPSAALYGANASSGVLNLVSKQPRYSQGGLLRLTGGDLSTFNGDFRWAGALGGDWYVKLLGGVRDSGDFTVSRNGAAEYTRPCGFTGDTDCLPQEAVPLNPLDDNQISFYGLRFDKYFGSGAALTFEGGAADVEGPAFQTGIGRVQLVEVERPWARANLNTTHWNVLAYQTTRDAARQTALGSGANLALDTERTGFEVQTNWSFNQDKVRLVLGASNLDEEIDSRDPRTGRQTLVFSPIAVDSQAVFGQIELTLSDKVRLFLAGRYDESDLHESQFSPKASLVYAVDPDNSLRFSYNEAFQVPNYSEFFLQAPAAPPIIGLQAVEALLCAPFGVACGFEPGPLRILALGNKDLVVEEVETFEIGYTGVLGGNTFVTVDYYSSANSNFITDLIPQLGTALGRVNDDFGPYQPPSALPPPVQAVLVGTLQSILGPAFALLTNNFDGTPILGVVSYANFGDVDTQGVDVGVNSRFADNWTFQLSYSWFDFDIKQNLPGFDTLLLPNSPENKFSLGLSFVDDRWDASIEGRHVDSFRWAVGPFQGDVEAYTTVDLNANLIVNDHVRLGVNVANLLDDEHWESFGGDLLGRRALGNVTLTW